MEVKRIIIWGATAIITIWVLLMLTLYMLAPKRVVGYSLGGSNFSSDVMFIRVDIENYEDDKITLQNITYQDAVKMVEQLNATLK